MESSERITVRLNSETAAALKILVDRGEFESLSDAVRKAMEEFISVRITSEEISKIVSDTDIEEDFSFIGKKDVEAMNEAIREAVTGFVRAKMESDPSDTDESKEVKGEISKEEEGIVKEEDEEEDPPISESEDDQSV